jgi:transposase
MEGYELKAYERFKEQAQHYRARTYDLEGELRVVEPQLYRAYQRIDRLEQRNQQLRQENKLLKQRVKDLTAQLKQKPKPPLPPFVKANTSGKRAKKPGRKAGHPAALRAAPAKIDEHQDLPLPIDAAGKVSCPHCKTQLNEVEHHQRVVEDIVPAKVITTCYHTTSGYCPCCRRRIESRAEDQPPAADLPHAQLGINALATAAVMRVCYRLPLRQITRLFAQLPGLKLSPAAIVKQLKRLSRWLEDQHDRLKLALRAAGVVHGDETGWRINGKNGYLWTLTNPTHTLYHIDRSRSAKVIVDLLGKSFGREGGGKLVSDFYGVYDRIGGTQQKCLAHLLRELRDTTSKRPQLSGHLFFRRCTRLIQDMLKLKSRRGQLGAKAYAHRVKLVEDRLLALSQGSWDDADAQRLTNRLAKYRDKLTPFLHHAELDGTNNAAERALRPAVVMRKITGGNRSASGAKAWAVLASVMRTAEQQGREVVDAVKTLLRSAWSGQQLILLTDALLADTS